MFFYLTNHYTKFIEKKVIPFLFGDYNGEKEGICCCHLLIGAILTLPIFIAISLPIIFLDLASLPIKIPIIIYKKLN